MSEWFKSFNSARTDDSLCGEQYCLPSLMMIFLKLRKCQESVTNNNWLNRHITRGCGKRQYAKFRATQEFSVGNIREFQVHK